MSRIVNAIGTIVFWLSWPFLHVILRAGSRTRVLVVSEGETLLVKDIIGSGHWSLPGGGLKLGEKPIDGAVRELLEETTIELTPSQLTSKGMHVGRNGDGHTYRYHLFTVELPKKPSVRRQANELRDICWMPLYEAKSSAEVGKVSKEVISQWHER